eukprot:TRINITY_DN90296_c0_g1_i1.p1 TRINITY_DN90296_c0_g1~~TRINITY_DN90296_c0_g1_i1.p1  ORF type:complete len:538 (+),score=176.55 TRINITY_DN90296_c0_g1_i1:73-1614(+)
MSTDMDEMVPQAASNMEASQDDWLAKELEAVMDADEEEEEDGVPPPPAPFPAAPARADDDTLDAPQDATEVDDGLGKTEEELFGSDAETAAAAAPDASVAGSGPGAAAVPSAASVAAASHAATEPTPAAVPHATAAPAAAATAPAAAAAAPAAPSPAASGDGSTPPKRAFPTSPSRSAAEEEMEKDEMIDETRFMQDEAGKKMLKWKVDYAGRGGGGRAMCHDNQCLEKEEQAGVRTIEKGSLRIGRRILMEKGSDGGGHVVILWYHACCIFNTFRRARQSTRVIESVADIEDFHGIAKEDQEMLARVIENNKTDLMKARLLGAKRGSAAAMGAASTPRKRGLDGMPDMEPPTAMKKAKKPNELEIKPGERIWCYCRVRPEERPGARPPGAPVEVAVRSPKPELGMIREGIRDGTIIVQFESAEHEKERLDMFASRKYARIRNWLKYPRLFEGKKQRIPLKWVQYQRVPPRLCSCTAQSWNHGVPCGLTCSRGTQDKVFGMDLQASSFLQKGV